jgi:hypothetical protein
MPVQWPATQRSAEWRENATPRIESTLWPEADRLFRSDPHWLGGDGAFSVDLGRSHVLWLFGDSFIATTPDARRTASAMVRNSVAIQTGYDPSKASLKFYWKTLKNKPTSFFAEEGNAWLWPMHGARLGGKLLLFFSRVRPDHGPHSLGFKSAGWTALLVSNPDEEPSSWTVRTIRVPINSWHIVIGAVLYVTNDFLYAFGFDDPDHNIYLSRWPLTAASKGDLSSPEWWCGASYRWTAERKLTGYPSPIFSGGSTEFSIQKDRLRNKFLEVQSVGFGASEIALRWADRLEGPWSDPVVVFRPPESDRPDAFVYAGKSHPELIGADMIITYVDNSNDQTLATDMTIYYPRFVRLTLTDELTSGRRLSR